MTRSLTVLGFLFLMRLMVSCDTQFVVLPKVGTTEVDSLGTDHATAHASIIDLGNGLSDHGHCFGTSSKPDINDGKVSRGKAEELYTYSTALKNLKPSTTYYVRAYIISEGQVSYGQEIDFSTYAGVTEVSTDAISEIMAFTATCKGNVLSGGGYPQITGGAIWSENPYPDLDSYLGIGIKNLSEGPFEVQLSGLEANTDYYVRTYAISEADTSFGEVKSFRTRDGIVRFGALWTVLESTSLVCESSIEDDGGSYVIARGICWSESEEPTTYGDHSVCGEGVGTFSCEVSGLEAGRKYHIRTFAKNLNRTNDTITYYSKEITPTTNPGK